MSEKDEETDFDEGMKEGVSRSIVTAASIIIDIFQGFGMGPDTSIKFLKKTFALEPDDKKKIEELRTALENEDPGEPSNEYLAHIMHIFAKKAQIISEVAPLDTDVDERSIN